MQGHRESKRPSTGAKTCRRLALRYDVSIMCRNIRTLHNFDPPATSDEIRAAALQYVRKVSGQTKPAKANEEAFAIAVDEVTAITERLLGELVAFAPAKNREEEAAKAKARWQKRAARMSQSA